MLCARFFSDSRGFLGGSSKFRVLLVILEVDPGMALVGDEACVAIWRPSSANVQISFHHQCCFQSKAGHFFPEPVLFAGC